MLVLTRKAEESLVLGEDIYIRVLRVAGQQVSIGIDAPKEVDIYREEILDCLMQSKEACLSVEEG